MNDADDTAIDLIYAVHPRERLRASSEHGQLWVTCLQCGAQWAIHGSDAEQVTDGDGYCEERSADDVGLMSTHQ